MRRTVQKSFDSLPFTSVDDFVANFNIGYPSSGLTVEMELPLHMRWVNRGSNTTMVVFSAAITRRSATEVPVFSGWSTTRELQCNVLMISDPSLILDTELNLAWYAGSEKQPELPNQLNEVLKVFASETRMILFGASGGGFAALQQALDIAGSTVLVSNPQTDIKLFSYYPTYLNLAWDQRDKEAPCGPAETTVLPSYTRTRDLTIVYCQNRGDLDHYERHYEPFMHAISSDTPVIPLTPDLGEGHIGPAPESFKEIFRVVAEQSSFHRLRDELSSLEVFSTKTAKTLR